MLYDYRIQQNPARKCYSITLKSLLCITVYKFTTLSIGLIMHDWNDCNQKKMYLYFFYDTNFQVQDIELGSTKHKVINVKAKN